MQEKKETDGQTGGVMSFAKDLELEKKCWEKLIKPYFKNYSPWWVKNDLQSFDIDFILMKTRKKISFSLKVVRKMYNNIFFETVKNTNTKKSGWGFYSKADYICYVFNFPNDPKIIIFQKENILKLNLKEFPEAEGYNSSYITLGKLIPISKFFYQGIEEYLTFFEKYGKI